MIYLRKAKEIDIEKLYISLNKKYVEKNKKNVTFASFHLYIISIIYHEKDNRMHFHHLLYIIML